MKQRNRFKKLYVVAENLSIFSMLHRLYSGVWYIHWRGKNSYEVVSYYYQKILMLSRRSLCSRGGF